MCARPHANVWPESPSTRSGQGLMSVGKQQDRVMLKKHALDQFLRARRTSSRQGHASLPTRHVHRLARVPGIRSRARTRSTRAATSAVLLLDRVTKRSNAPETSCNARGTCSSRRRRSVRQQGAGYVMQMTNAPVRLRPAPRRSRRMGTFVVHRPVHVTRKRRAQESPPRAHRIIPTRVGLAPGLRLALALAGSVVPGVGSGQSSIGVGGRSEHVMRKSIALGHLRLAQKMPRDPMGKIARMSCAIEIARVAEGCVSA